MYHILVAEDEPWIRHAVVEMVKRIVGPEAELFEATNGEEAWEIILDVWPTVLITDIMMPGMDGLTLISKVEEHHIPMAYIVISGYDNFQYAQQAIRYGVTEYLLKPVDMEHMQSAIERIETRLAKIMEINHYLSRFQQLVNSLGETEPRAAVRKMSDLIDTVLNLRFINFAARTNLLRIFDMKLVGMIREFTEEAISPIDAREAEDEELRRHFGLLYTQLIMHVSEEEKLSTRHSIRKVCEYIHTHYHKDISLTEMARHANMSISYFSYWFKKSTNRTLVQYIQETRIAKAKELLLETNMKNYEIAEKVGFATQSYFVRVFKNSVGMSPNIFRKRMGL